MANDADNEKNKKPGSNKLTPEELGYIIATVVLIILLAVLAWFSAHNNWLIPLAISVGGIGGLIHEIAQSGGKFLLFKRQEDGIYLGSLTGMVLGAVAGLLIIGGYVTGSVNTPVPNSSQIIYEVFFAGLALKGVAEAAGGTAVPLKENGGTTPKT